MDCIILDKIIVKERISFEKNIDIKYRWNDFYE
jgi:hypothetical protein